jgi:hypothetical protein
LRPQEAVVINLANVGDLVADRRNLADGRLKQLLSVLCTAKTVTRILPNVGRKQERR